MWKYREILVIFILGLITIPNNCDGRAVNISNTWTLPHDGFSVFYRFFRDQISWFEADAVCQFHHANLVTVDSSSEFDAAREFLRVLDVSEPVWIGLMRPQNSERFTWSNSKPLTITSENWAESLPLIDAPLCAVTDPIRDYRWHALRCGGPETASFLCEMNVPSWAEECVLRDIPSLTIQYMADSGTVEITKDCGIDEGTIHQVCRGKQDQERIIKKLICKNEKQPNTKQNLLNDNPMSPNINNMDSKILSKINNIPSDNNEDNNINTQLKQYPPTNQQQTENPVQKLIEQFNVEELMQSDQPSSDNGKSVIVEDKVIDAIPKPVKKLNKKVKSKLEKKIKQNKKNQPLPQLKGKNIALEDMMMGDQPIDLGSSQSLDNDDMNEIQAPLPHTKKSLSLDLKHHENVFNEKELHKTTTTENLLKSITTTTVASNIIDATNQNDRKDENIELNSSTTKESVPLSIENESVATTISNLQTEKLSTQFDSVTTATSTLITSSSPLASSTHNSVDIITTEKPLATIGHPMHPQQPRTNVMTEETGHQHIKETNDNHFIPPMLMVKSHYTPPKSNHNTDQQIDLKEHLDIKTEFTITEKNLEEITIAPINNNEELNKNDSPMDSFNFEAIKTTLNSENNSTLSEVTTKSAPATENIEVVSEKIPSLTTLQSISSPTTSTIDLTTSDTLTGHQVVEIKIGNSDNPTTFSITTRGLPQQSEHLETTKSILPDSDLGVGDVIELTTKIPEVQQPNNKEPITNTNDEESTTLINNKIESNNDDLISPTTTSTSVNQLQETIEITKTNKITSTSSPADNNFSSFGDDKTFSETTEQQQQQQEIKTFSNIRTETETATTTAPTTTKIIPSTTTVEHHSIKVKQSEFSNEDNIDTYKPNRRRSLTKPENTSYLKKILG